MSAGLRLLLPVLLLPVLLLPVLLLPANVSAADSVVLLPRQFTLDGPESRHRILIERVLDGEFRGPADASLVAVSDRPDVAVVTDGVIIPVGDGTATIRVTGPHNQPDVSSGTTIASVTVRNLQTQNSWSFRNHVEPVLAKQGCSSGACHGALAGKGGFRLSLRGYDPDRDFLNIARQQQGRRIEPAQPAASLLLTKPTMSVPHKGGLRIEPGSLNYRVVAEWIAAGATAPGPEDERLERLEILPEQVTLAANAAQPLLVRAHYAGGRVEDVTHWAKFTSANEAVVTVDEQGVARIVGPGEGAVTAWFSSQIVIARITVPWTHQLPPVDFSAADRRNFIDDLTLKQLKRLNLQPAERCTDSVFLRRAFLDTIGTLPTAAEVRDFLADQSVDKRDRVIDQLLHRTEFVDYWTCLWSDLLLISSTELSPEAVRAYYDWTRTQVAENVPWDQFATRLVTAAGSSLQNGATNFYALHDAPEDMAENVSQAFLGLSIGCARCHNHPLEKWTNDQYYAFSNLFSRVRAKSGGIGSDTERILVTVSSGELIQPRTGKAQLPAPLDAAPIPFNRPGDRRGYLATWLTSPSNALFARSITNRVWKNFFGTGLVEAVDDMRTSNPASNEELLAEAAAALVDGGFDLKALMRTILQSETWQRSSTPGPGNLGDRRHYSRYCPRRLMAEVLLDAVSQVTDVPSEFTQLKSPGGEVRQTDRYPRGTRAIQLSDAAVDSYFLQTFGRHQRRITCACERSDEPSMVQVLHLSNGDTINAKLGATDNRLTRWLLSSTDDSALLDEVFLTCLSRFPRPVESETFLTLLAETPPEQRREVLEDMVWSIISSREVLFNH